jgi:hypothetical protein
MFGFEGLQVWQKAVEYAGTIYDVTRTFPEEERFWSNTPTTPVVSLYIFQHRRGIIPIIQDRLQSFYRNRLRVIPRVRVGIKNRPKTETRT